MDKIFNLLNNSFFTTLLGAVIGGLITFKFNYYHEKRKLIMEQKLKAWEKISEYFEEIFSACQEIENEYLESSLEDIDTTISVFKPKVNQILGNINKIDSKLKNYYILFENGNYLYELKTKLFNFENQVYLKGESISCYEFQKLFNEFYSELSNIHAILNVELVKILDDKKTRKRRLVNFKNKIKVNKKV